LRKRDHLVVVALNIFLALLRLPVNQELSKSSYSKPRDPARHQYGLQIAEGMVIFFESYERELEKYKYWTRTHFSQLS
jgi:hypothetical protein